MLVDIASVEHAVKYAQKIARKMSQDPEVDSIAGEAAWKALYTYDLKRGVKLSWWIAQLTKQGVIHYWRRMSKLREKEKLRDELWWSEQTSYGRVTDKGAIYDDDNLRKRRPAEHVVEVENKDDWQLLIESFVLQVPLDVLAHARGISVGDVKRMRAAAISRLEVAS